MMSFIKDIVIRAVFFRKKYKSISELAVMLKPHAIILCVKYPFIPKSNKFLERGHFFPIKLSNGKYACAVVINSSVPHLGKTKFFYGGILNWREETFPTQENIKSQEIIDHGYMHINSLIKNNLEIYGRTKVNNAYSIPTNIEELDKIRTWGYTFIIKRAEKLFAVKK